MNAKEYRDSLFATRDKDTVYVTPVPDIRAREGARVFFVDWWDEHFHSGPGWRGQIFHTERDVGAEMASKLGRKLKTVPPQKRAFTR